jgi:hypothetical protein
VQTHSLTATEYNGLSGAVTGEVTINKKNETRVPVSLQLLNGKEESKLLQLRNLTITEEQQQGGEGRGHTQTQAKAGVPWSNTSSECGGGSEGESSGDTSKRCREVRVPHTPRP